MKEFFSKQVTNKMIWGTLIAAVAIIIVTTIATVLIVNYKTNSIQVGAVPSENKSSNTENNEENVVDMNTLTDVSKISEEELKKLNEKELEEAKKKEEEEKKNTTTTTNNKRQNKYYIKVNYGAQVVNVYTYDKNGKYTVPVKAFVCSTGTETPKSGVYKIPAKITWCKMFGDVYAHYCTQIVGNILFHSVPYLEKNNHTLEYWAYDKLGTKASMGCVRLTTRDAKWIFDNISVGTQVEFYSNSNPGPLGKPTAQKISNAPGDLKWWDPTDPDSSNPWKNYKPEENNTQKNEQNTTNNTTIENQTTENSQTGNNQNSQMESTESQNNQIGSNTTQNSQAGNTTTPNNQTGNNTTQNAANTNNQTQNGQTVNNATENGQTNNNTQGNNGQNNMNNQQQNGQTNNQMTDTQI